MSLTNQEQDQLNAYLQKQQRERVEGASKVVMDFGNGPEDASKYLTMRDPGITPLKMLADPYCILKDGESKRKAWRGVPGGQHAWRNPNDRNTKHGVHKGDLRPVEFSEVDMDSEHAVFDETVLDTERGKKRVVTHESLCLYEVSAKKAYEWVGAAVDRHKRDLTMMKYGASKELRAQGYGDVNPADLARFAGADPRQSASNVAVSDPKVENALD
jgi:hypothetical protein